MLEDAWAFDRHRPRAPDADARDSGPPYRAGKTSDRAPARGRNSEGAAEGGLTAADRPERAQRSSFRRRPPFGSVVEFSQMVMGPSLRLDPRRSRRRRDQGRAAQGRPHAPFQGRRARASSPPTAATSAASRWIRRPRPARTIARRLIESRRPDREFPPGPAEAARPRLRVACAISGLALIYCSLKGYLPGPYENRLALDEVVQMMGGLAYMTGLPGRPMRAGASVNDIMGGMFGVIAIQAALAERAAHRARHIHPERAVREQRLPHGQAMMFESVTGQARYPSRSRTAPGRSTTSSRPRTTPSCSSPIVGEEHWAGFCRASAARPGLPIRGSRRTRAASTSARWLIPEIAAILRE